MDCSLDDYAKANKISSRGKKQTAFYNAGMVVQPDNFCPSGLFLEVR